MAGMDDAEYDFRDFRDARQERFERFGRPSTRHPPSRATAAHALLDLGAMAANTSALNTPIASPRLQAIDASAITQNNVQSGGSSAPASVVPIEPLVDDVPLDGGQDAILPDGSVSDPYGGAFMDFQPVSGAGLRRWNDLEFEVSQEAAPFSDDFYKLLEQTGYGGPDESDMSGWLVGLGAEPE